MQLRSTGERRWLPALLTKRDADIQAGITESANSATSITPPIKRACSSTHSSTLGVVSATLIVALVIAQGNGQLRRPVLPSFLLIIWRTIAVACNQSSSLGPTAMREHSDSTEHFHFDDVS